MKIIVYVEGPSDRATLTTLFASLIQSAHRARIRVLFLPLGGKGPLMTKVARRAANELPNDRSLHVFALPDLYPPDIGYPHRTCDELKGTLLAEFRSICADRGLRASALVSRFHVHCLKHDLEALLLAAEEDLKHHLGVRSFRVGWTRPVEDQNLNHPPKRIVEQLFRRTGRRYVETIDAPAILAGAAPDELAVRCPQCFGPFYRDLQEVVGVATGGS